MARVRPEPRPSIPQQQGAPDSERELVERVVADVMGFEDGIGKDFRTNCVKWFRQYRGFRVWADAWTKAGPNDRDGMVYDAKKHWGAHLHIPLTYRTIETMVPRAVAQRPRLQYLPRQQKWEENVHNVRLLIDAQQDNIDIDLPFQAVMRSGRIYGIGAGKTFWMTDWIKRRKVDRRMFLPNKFFLKDPSWEKVFDDPYFEDVDIFDLMWDPYGSDVRTSRWMVHRTWMSLETCLDRIEGGAWSTESAKLLDEEKLRRMGSANLYDEVWSERMIASGFSSFTTAGRGEQPHELLEWHDGEQVISVLDRAVCVQDRENGCYGHKPLHVYRPTPLQKQMVGIGDPEALEHLQRELDTMRSQMTDAVTIALCAGFAFDEAMVDREDLQLGPAAAIPVRNGSPGEALMPLQVKNLPAGAFQHQDIVRQDFDLVSGVGEALQPGQGASSTATEAQLVQASISARIQLSSRRFEIEIVRQAARAFLYLNQRMIMSQRPDLRVPDGNMDPLQAANESRWQWFPIGPNELRGEFEIIPEGGSMAARNVPQDRQDAQIMLQLAQHPMLDPRRPLTKALTLLGVDDPSAWLKQSEPPVPPLALQLLQRYGVPPGIIQQAVQNAQAVDPQLGPNTEQVGQMMNGNGAQPVPA